MERAFPEASPLFWRSADVGAVARLAITRFSRPWLQGAADGDCCEMAVSEFAEGPT